MRPVGLSHVENQKGNRWDEFSGQKTEKWMGKVQDPFLQLVPVNRLGSCPAPSLFLSFPPLSFPFLHF